MLISSGICILGILITGFIPTVLANSSNDVDRAGFWVSFFLLVVVSAIEAVMSIIYTSIRASDDGVHEAEISIRVCGREIKLEANPYAIDRVATVRPGGCYCGSDSSITINGRVSASGSGISCCGCYTRNTYRDENVLEVSIDIYGGMSLVPVLLIRRFDPKESMTAAAGLVDNIRAMWKGGISVRRYLEHVIHIVVGLIDVGLGVASFALNPNSVLDLYEAIKDPMAPLGFDNYSTLFLIYWFVGAILLLCMIPLRSQRRSIQIFGFPAAVVFIIASLASGVLFGLGCWKIDQARKNNRDWTPMLSYWIGGASLISLPLCGLQVFHTFGVVGLVFMLINAF